MSILHELQRVSAWRAVVVACLLNMIVVPLDVIFGVPGRAIWPALLSSTVAATLFVVLVLTRRNASVRWSSIAFLTNVCAMVVVTWTSNTSYAAHARGWVPYQADKLAVLVVALLSPEFSTGVVSIAAFAGAAVVHYLLLPSALKIRAFNEPWTTAVYAVAGLGLLWLQMRRRNAEWATIRLQADKAAMERFARSAMAVRHIANTPLQTIELTRAHLQVNHPELRRDLERMARSIEGLRELNAILREYEEQASWTPSDESFDPHVRLRMHSSD